MCEKSKSPVVWIRQSRPRRRRYKPELYAVCFTEVGTHRPIDQPQKFFDHASMDLGATVPISKFGVPPSPAWQLGEIYPPKCMASEA